MLSGNDYGEWKLETGNWERDAKQQNAICGFQLSAIVRDQC